MKNDVICGERWFVGWLYQRRPPVCSPEIGASVMFPAPNCAYAEFNLWRCRIGVSAGVLVGRGV